MIHITTIIQNATDTFTLKIMVLCIVNLILCIGTFFWRTRRLTKKLVFCHSLALLFFNGFFWLNLVFSPQHETANMFWLHIVWLIDFPFSLAIIPVFSHNWALFLFQCGIPGIFICLFYSSLFDTETKNKPQKVFVAALVVVVLGIFNYAWNRLSMCIEFLIPQNIVFFSKDDSKVITYTNFRLPFFSGMPISHITVRDRTVSFSANSIFSCKDTAFLTGTIGTEEMIVFQNEIFEFSDYGELSIGSGSNDNTNNVIYSSNNEFMASTKSDSILGLLEYTEVWDCSQKIRICQTVHMRGSTKLSNKSFSKDGSQFLLLTELGVEQWDLKRKECIAVYVVIDGYQHLETIDKISLYLHALCMALKP